LLGKDYPGLFGVGNSQQLAHLLRRAECNAKFLAQLKSRVKKLSPLFDPAQEDRGLVRSDQRIACEEWLKYVSKT
jgi:hypothetical protein